MKNKKLLPLLAIGLLLAIAVRCSEQILTPAQIRQDIIDNAMKPENFSNLKHNFAFLESKNLLQPDSFLNLLQENITESQDATFHEVIERAEDLLTEHMRKPFIQILSHALMKNKSFDAYINLMEPTQIPLFNYIMQRKGDDKALHNIVRGWLLQWADLYYENGVIPLYVAAEKGHAEIVRLLLEAGANVEITNTKNGITPLQIAVQEGHTEIVRLLLTAHADVNIQNSFDGMTSLHIAVAEGYTEIVRLLLAAGANVNIKNTENGMTPLYIAAEQGYAEIVRSLLTYGADVEIESTQDEQKALYIAAEKGHIKIVKILLEATANAVDEMTEILYLAAEKGHAEIVEFLISKNVNVNPQEHDDDATPLYYAAKQGYIEIVRLLLAAGANIDIANTETGMTPLYIAAEQGHVEIVRLLLAAGANATIQAHNGQIAQYVAKTDEIREILRGEEQTRSVRQRTH